MTTRFPIDLGLADIEITEVTTDAHGHYHIRISSTVSEGQCRVCDRPLSTFHEYDRELRIRHLPILGRDCYLYIRLPRFRCDHCPKRPTTTQQPVWRERKSNYTKAYEQHLLKSLIGSTLSEAGRQEGVTAGCLSRLLERRVQSTVDWKPLKQIGQLGIDEIALKKGHKDFVTIISSRHAGEIRVLAVLKDRRKETVKGFLNTMPKQLRQTIQAVCSDLYEGFINATKEVLGKRIRVVIDRFHVARLYRKELDTLRKQEMKRLKKNLDKASYAELKGTMWALRKSPGNLTGTERTTLSKLFDHSPDLKQAYQLCQQLTTIFNTPTTRNGGIRRLKNWIKAARSCGLNCFNTFIGTLEKWIKEIANYFVARENSGFVEGLNNRIKVIKRRCYGLVDSNHLFQRITLELFAGTSN